MAQPDACRILIADDEPDIHSVTRLSLKGLRWNERGIELISAHSGAETLERLRSMPDVAVLLLDVVMESDSAGLDTCRAIREQLHNRFVRILLRTGQPGAAPERKTIDEYDIDGYLPKAELTSNRLYTQVRTALKAYDELTELERHRSALATVHECVTRLRSYAPLEQTLQHVLDAVAAIWPSPLCALWLETFEAQGNPRRYFLYRSTASDRARGQADAEALAAHVARAAAGGQRREPAVFEQGFLVPLELHRELGHGWIYVADAALEPLRRTLLPILAAHAANALYSAVAEAMLKGPKLPLFESMEI